MRVQSVILVMLSMCLATLQAFSEAKNAILFVGDGMGLAQVTAARIYQKNARDGKLTLDTFEQVALVRTFASNTLVTDSAAAGTALATGFKTDARMVSVDPDGNPLETVLEKAKREGKSVGVVTTTTLSHATPASFYAHAKSRNDEAGIAAQLIDGGLVDVAMGGGREHFLPSDAAEPESNGKGKRRDDRNLIAEAKAKGMTVIQRQSEFDAWVAKLEDGSGTAPVLALFQGGHMNYEAHRANDQWGEPSIAEMTAAAIKLLSRNPKGFFLMVEGGRIDHASHANAAQLMARELLAFDEAITTGRDMTGDDTLIIITADHETGGLAINGYPSIDIGGDELFRASTGPGGGSILTWASGPGALRERETREKDDPDYKQPSLVPGSSAAHTGIDVIAWASGPGSEHVKGTVLNSDLGRILIESLGLE